jgi:signal transduction histidine kinase
MSLRYRLILMHLSIMAFLIAIFCLAIYIQSEQYRQNEFNKRLKEEAIMASTIFFTKSEISPDILKLLDRNNFTMLFDEEIFIFSKDKQIVYESGEDKLIINDDKIDEIIEKKEVFWRQKNKEYYGTTHKKLNFEYIIVSSAIDKYGLIKQRNLAKILVYGGVIVLLLSALVGWVLVRNMLKPLNEIIDKIDNIKVSKLNLRLEIGKRDDEFSQLAVRFNQMLDRLQKAFLSQKAFVSHASHELRTPLTSITGQIQVSLLANDNLEDLRKMINSVLEDVQDLNKLSNNLLDLTSLNTISENSTDSLLNILEKISRVRDELLKKNPDAIIFLDYVQDEENIPELNGNLNLLFSAFFNLIENGIKYSPNKTVSVLVKTEEDNIIIKIENVCDILNNEDLNQIFEPFKRGKNAKNIKGHGVGLSLAKGIIELHSGTITTNYNSLQEICFIITLPKNLIQF